LIQILRDGTRLRYSIMSAHEVPGCEGYPPPKLDADEQKLFDEIASGKNNVPAKGGRDWQSYCNPRTVAAELLKKGRVERPYESYPNHYRANVYDAETAAKPD